MNSMNLTKFTIFLKLNSFSVIMFVFNCIIISLFTFYTIKFNSISHLKHLLKVVIYILIINYHKIKFMSINFFLTFLVEPYPSANPTPPVEWLSTSFHFAF